MACFCFVGVEVFLCLSCWGKVIFGGGGHDYESLRMGKGIEMEFERYNDTGGKLVQKRNRRKEFG
jgi:hypothetical protein